MDILVSASSLGECAKGKDASMLRKLWIGLLLGALAGVPCVFAESGSPDLKAVNSPWHHADGTGKFRKSQELVRHTRNQARLAGQVASAAATSFDAGDVAVIVDNGRIFSPPRPANPFDLAVPSGLHFTHATDAFSVSATTTALDTDMGADLGLGDDDATPVESADSGVFNSGGGFPFLGTNYSTNQIFVGSDGHITFGEAEASSTARDAGRHVGGPPRLSPLFADLDPSSAGSVHADVRSDRVVVTWSGLPEFGLTNVNTVQAVLHADGDIDFVYSKVDLLFAVVGLAEGHDEGPINELDLSQDLPVSNLGAGAIFEEFLPAIIVQQMDVIQLGMEFYQTHADKFDFLVMFTEDVVDIGGGAFAFHAGLHIENQGLGFFLGPNASNAFDFCSLVGLTAGCELESLLNMNRIGLYWPDQEKLVNPPIRKFRFACLNAGGQVVPCGATFGGPPGSNQVSLRARWMGTLNGDFGDNGAYTLGLNSAMSIMGQETGHRWLAFPAFQRPVSPFSLSSALLGRSQAHWSFFFNVTVPPDQFQAQDGDPRASSAEGNAILDLGPDPRCTALTPPRSRLFQTEPDELIDGYTELDQYFMGLRKASEVPSFWYIRNPMVIFGGAPNASSSARDDVLICGDRENLTVANITAAGAFLGPSNGPRDPVLGDEQDAGPGIGSADNARCTGDRECVDVKTMAFILLVKGDPSSNASRIRQVDNFRRAWEQYANDAAIAGRGARGRVGDPDYIKKFDTSLAPVIH
jgi:hypothetical protein